MIFVDAHVHLYPGVPIAEAFDAAYENFTAAATGQRASDGCSAGVLLLAETDFVSGVEGLNRLWNATQSPERARSNFSWRLEDSVEPETFFATGKDGRRLCLIGGRQILTHEGLEVLALATDGIFTDGEPIRDVIEKVRSAGAVPVLPWGVGKWIGKRGQTINDLIHGYRGREFFLGDNSGRPRFWQQPGHFEQGRQKGIAILPGSDPLPFIDGYLKVGSFGFSLPGMLDPNRPAAQLRYLLMETDIIPEPYGRLEDGGRFIVNQLKMQIRKRFLRPS